MIVVWIVENGDHGLQAAQIGDGAADARVHRDLLQNLERADLAFHFIRVQQVN